MVAWLVPLFIPFIFCKDKKFPEPEHYGTRVVEAIVSLMTTLQMDD